MVKGKEGRVYYEGIWDRRGVKGKFLEEFKICEIIILEDFSLSDFYMFGIFYRWLKEDFVKGVLKSLRNWK